MPPQHTRTRRDPSRGFRLTSRPKTNLAQSLGSRHHRPMPPQPSDTSERLSATNAERMGMRPIEQLPETSRCEHCGASELQQILGENR